MSNTIKRRNLLKAGALAPAVMAGAAGAAAAASPGEAHRVKGWGLTPAAQSNPLEARITAFTVVCPDLDAGIKFYKDVIGLDVIEQGSVAAGLSTAPGAGRAARRYAVLRTGSAQIRGAAVRLLEAPAGAAPNRPRPTSRIFDPGLTYMECGVRDAVESYRVLANAGTPTVSTPRYYFFRNTGMGPGPTGTGTMRDLDVMSYSAFGPAGEQMFITANLRGDRPEWTNPGLHGNYGAAVLASLDQRPVEEFYRKALGLRRINQMDCNQRNANDLMGAPKANYFVWGFIGDSVSIELQEHSQAEGTMYPTSLDRTGLAMFTIAVNDLAKARAMCKAAGINPVGTGALPMPGRPKPEGFTLRGAVGELIEVVAK